MIFRRLFLRFSGDYECARFVEAVTDYVEGTMRARERARFEDHITKCDGCERYLAQMRETIELSGRITVRDVESIPAPVRTELLAAFRQFHAGG